MPDEVSDYEAAQFMVTPTLPLFPGWARAVPHVIFHGWRLPGGLTQGAPAAAQVNPLTA